MTNDKVIVVRYAVGFRKTNEPRGIWTYISRMDGTGAVGSIPFPFIVDQLDAHQLGLKLAQNPAVAEVTVRARRVSVLKSLVAAT